MAWSTTMRASGAMFALATAIAGASGCAAEASLPPLGQILLFVDTDAPLPPPAGQARGPNEPTPLFDRVRIEIHRPGETEPCGECTNEFDVDRAVVGEGRASVGIKPPPHVTGYVARVRLFRAAYVELGQPRRDATIDVTVALPPVEDEGITPVTVFLRTDDVASPVGTMAAPIAPEPGPPPGGRVGTWPGARRVGCTDAPGPHEVCVPGGAFWMGNPLIETMQVGADDVVLRLVVMSPFYLDKREVIVPAYRFSGVVGTRDPIRNGDSLTSGQPLGMECNYTDTFGNGEALPVNCISYPRARAFCTKIGGDLPTEAQYQYAAGGLESRLYPWGSDAPSCDDAVFARVRQSTGADFSCAGGGIEPAGSGRRDRIAYEGGEVVDLAGNLAEYARDRWNLQIEGCWRSGVLHDPVCETPSAVAEVRDSTTVVGGAFLNPGGFLAAAFRQPSHSFPPSRGVEAQLATGVGFRCARPATPAP